MNIYLTNRSVLFAHVCYYFNKINVMFAYTCNQLNRIEIFSVSEIKGMNITNCNHFVGLLQVHTHR
jgi:hypothetical protein